MKDFRPYALCLLRVLAGLLFMQHGLEKLFGFAGARPEPTLWGIRGVGGILETFGGPMLVLGIFTRPTAFILSGEMAVAYFRSWAPRGFFPIANGGEEATLNAFIFLWLSTAGAGAWSLDALVQAVRPLGALRAKVMTLEPYARAILRLIIGFLLTLHGCRKLFGVFIAVAGRRNAPALALDSLPMWTGGLELAGGVLLVLGLFVRQTALVISVEALVAYALVAAPRTLWPIRNGGIEALLYFAVCLCFAAWGGGAWAVDSLRRSQPRA